MSCLCSSDPGERRSKEQDKKIVKWMKHYRSTIKLLLLGAGESGKTTILKQMKILHVKGFSEEERREKILNIKRNILEAIQEIIKSMKFLDPPLNLENAEKMDSAEFIENIEQQEKYDFPQEFFHHVSRLWEDPGVQECYRRSNEYFLIDSAKYFLDQVNIVSESNYMPSDQDILCCRKRTSEIQKIEFDVKIPKKYGGGIQSFWMFDVGGQRGERRKWIQVFEGITAVLFLVASSGFDMRIREDKKINRLDEAFSLFEDVWHSRFLQDSGFITFFNKQDILKEKIEAGARLENYYPEYKNYNLKKGDVVESTEYERARCFIRDKFLELTKKPNHSKGVTRHSVSYNSQRDPKRRECFWHFTTATDTNNVKKVFDDIHTMIIMWNLDTISPQ